MIFALAGVDFFEYLCFIICRLLWRQMRGYGVGDS